MGSYLKILLPESTTVKQMPGKTVSRSFSVCHVCWQAGWISWLMFCAWLCSAILAPYLEKAIPLSAISINYCHRPAWLTAAPALAASRCCCCGVFFAGSSVASGFVRLTFLVTGDRVSLVSNMGELSSGCGKALSAWPLPSCRASSDVLLLLGRPVQVAFV